MNEVAVFLAVGLFRRSSMVGFVNGVARALQWRSASEVGLSVEVLSGGILHVAILRNEEKLLQGSKGLALASDFLKMIGSRKLSCPLEVAKSLWSSVGLI